MNEKEFSIRLARLREQKKVSAREMSLSLGQNPGYINNIETGKSLPSLLGFFYICEYLGIEPADFFDTESEAPCTLKGLISDMKKLNQNQLEHVSAIVKDIVK